MAKEVAKVQDTEEKVEQFDLPIEIVQEQPQQEKKGFSSSGQEVKKQDSFFPYGVNKVDKLTVFAGITKGKNDVEWNVIDFKFSDIKGSSFTHRIFDWSSQEDESKLEKNALKAIMESKYIINKAFNNNIEIEGINSFADLQEFVKAQIKAGVLLPNHQINISAIQHLKTGKWNAGFVTYSISEKNPQWGFGWFHNLTVDPPITLDNKQKSNIISANNVASPPPSSNGAGRALETDDELPF